RDLYAICLCADTKYISQGRGRCRLAARAAAVAVVGESRGTCAGTGAPATRGSPGHSSRGVQAQRTDHASLGLGEGLQRFLSGLLGTPRGNARSETKPPFAL